LAAPGWELVCPKIPDGIANPNNKAAVRIANGLGKRMSSVSGLIDFDGTRPALVVRCSEALAGQDFHDQNFLEIPSPYNKGFTAQDW
jgi:hypothetical protein